MPKFQISFHDALQIVLLSFIAEVFIRYFSNRYPREEGAAEIITLFAKCYPQAVYEKEREANQ